MGRIAAATSNAEHAQKKLAGSGRGKHDGGVRQLKCIIDSYTDAGTTCAGNEDAIAHIESKGVAVLADGLGGHKAGDVASRRTVDGVLSRIDNYLDSRSGAPTLDEAQERLKVAIAEQNHAIFEQAGTVPGHEGMGCTLVVVWLVQKQALVANIGDSRCYHLRKQVLTQVTRDHSFIQFQLDYGLVSEEEARTGQSKNYLLRSVGAADKVVADFFVVDLEPGDILLAASDGMTQTLCQDTLQDKVLEAMKSPQPARALVTAAMDSGSRDNVSVQVIKVGPDE